jgi:hypothetical protein
MSTRRSENGLSAIQKAGAFVQILKENGWKGKIDADEKNDYAKIFAHRDQEKLEIEWYGNQLVGPPKYEFAGTVAKLHSAAVARKHVRGRPDVQLYIKRKRRHARAAKNNSSNGAPVEIDVTQHELPFDIETSTDKEILRVLRGSTIVWKNRFTGLPESEYISRERNRDLTNVFYIAESSKGRPYVSFMTDQGVFRAVGLDVILQVR